jgi:5-formyltetrahydrofolate cyclo-ligase
MGPEGKAALRARLAAARRAVADDLHAAEARALQQHLATLTTGADTVCAYVPIGAEPGTPAMLDTLLRRGLRVLLPAACTTDNGGPLPLQWGEYRPGRLVTAPPLGLLEPPEPWLPPAALSEAGLVLAPALAVDDRGVRLGRGAGFYDRSLVLRDPDAQLVAIVRDEELLDELPSEPHDVLMTHALTPGLGLVARGMTSPA